LGEQVDTCVKNLIKKESEKYRIKSVWFGICFGTFYLLPSTITFTNCHNLEVHHYFTPKLVTYENCSENKE